MTATIGILAASSTLVSGDVEQPYISNPNMANSRLTRYRDILRKSGRTKISPPPSYEKLNECESRPKRSIIG